MTLTPARPRRTRPKAAPAKQWNASTNVPPTKRILKHTIFEKPKRGEEFVRGATHQPDVAGTPPPPPPGAKEHARVSKNQGRA